MTDASRRGLTVPQLLHADVTNSADTEQRCKRQNAVNFARASLGLEGFKLSEACEQQAARFVAGEIELLEFLKHPR